MHGILHFRIRVTWKDHMRRLSSFRSRSADALPGDNVYAGSHIFDDTARYPYPEAPYTLYVADPCAM